MNTPILFIIFNRPETTIQVFEAIRQVKPKQLFIAADGPRLEKGGEAQRCAEARRIATNVDWDCEVKTLFRHENIGCGRGPADAISWFFQHVEQGIILEDDCLPDPSFFPFCEELLEKYKQSDVVLISGFNSLERFDAAKEDYFFTHCGGIWGWASWRRAWKVYNFSVPEWNNELLRNKVLQSLPSDQDRIDMKDHLEHAAKGERNDYWDFQWWFYRKLQNGIGIVPSKNLITNIGFGKAATHTFDAESPIAYLKAQSLNFPLIHPAAIEEDKRYEQELLQKAASAKHPVSTISIRSLLSKINSKLRHWKAQRRTY